MEVLDYLFQLVAEQLKAEDDVFDSIFDRFEGNGGFSGEILEAKLDKLKGMVGRLSDSTPGKSQMEDELAFLELCIEIHKIFIQRNLNRNARLVAGDEKRARDHKKRATVLQLNIDEEFQRMAECIKFFDNWRQWCKTQEKDMTPFDVDQWKKLCIHQTTLRNIKISVFGFLNYAKEVLSDPSCNVSFVPYLHNNSSTLESTFSVLRATHKDSSVNLAKGLLAANLKSSIKMASTHLIPQSTALQKTKDCVVHSLI